LHLALDCVPFLCRSSSRNVSGPTPTAVFALATPKSPMDRGGNWQLHLFLYCKLFCFSVLLSGTHQGRAWNQTTQPELVTKPWQRLAHAQTACVSHITLSEAEQSKKRHILGMMDLAVTGDGASRCPKSGSWALRASRGSTLAGTTRGPSPCLCRASVWTGRAGRPLGRQVGTLIGGRSTSVMLCSAMHHTSHSYLSLCPFPFP
jgi:hypothetical protein